MKKLLLTVISVALSAVSMAQDLKPVKISSASASSYNSTSENAAKAIDGNHKTYWHSQWQNGSTQFPVEFQITMSKETMVDIVRYVPRQDQPNGAWGNVEVQYRGLVSTNNEWVTLGTFNLGERQQSYDFEIGKKFNDVKFIIKNGYDNFATAAEVEAYTVDNTKYNAFKAYFQDDLLTTLKPEVTSSEGIEDADVKALVDNLLADKDGYSKFRVGEYEPYRTVWSLQSELKTSAPYNQWENPTGIYLKAGESCWVAVSGVKADKVGLKIRNWVKDESGSTYSLRNGLNQITAATEGNVFVDYYTDNFENAPNVNVHFINAPVRGYWDQETMTNEDWKAMLKPLKSDSSIIIVRSEHAQVAYPVCAWKQHCPTNVDSLMTLYEQVQWAERDMMGLKKYGREVKNRQLYFASTYGFMAAANVGAYCNVGSLGAIMAPDSKEFDFWGVGHEWGHNNQITPGFKWSGCGETTNNIYASWAQIHFTGNPSYMRLEDEKSGIDEYSGMRGGRMQTYFEEGLRKGVQWQLQDGPDYHGETPKTITVDGYDYKGAYIGMVETTSRNYDHFVKLVPFWQLNLWGTLAGKCPDIIPMVIEGIRTTDDYGSKYSTNGRQQINWMKLACDSAKINLLPFFEKAGMLKPINAYIEDYGAGWNIITEGMIKSLKNYVVNKGYPDFTEEINYINAHNYKIYRENLKLEVPATVGSGCTIEGNMVKVNHRSVKNAVAYETYNSSDELIRITMYGLGSDDSHSYTMVLYPSSTEESEAAAYIVAVGYDGTRKKVYDKSNLKKGLTANRFYTIESTNKGNALSCGTGTSINQSGEISWNLLREAKASSANVIWYLESDGDNTYLYNPQSNSYFTGIAGKEVTSLCAKKDAPTWALVSVDENKGTYTINMSGTNQYVNAYNETKTGLWSGGASEANNIWRIEQVKSVTVNIPAAGYYSGCYPFALELPHGLKAYVIAETATMEYDGTSYDYAVLDLIEGNIVPAYMPVIYAGTSGNHTVTLKPDFDLTLTTANKLHGTTLKKTGFAKGGALVNIYDTEKAGTKAYIGSWYSQTDVPVNSAYLLKSEVDGKSRFYLQTRDVLTGIGDIKEDATGAGEVFYELDGKRASKLQNGRVYVTSNGKTILIR
ncbi:MAG: M60 family metallopeptidase [Bacteroidaceae bacterium]|nr:M60 family metallopeptidase [Bacteroidaceae bacterium]